MDANSEHSLVKFWVIATSTWAVSITDTFNIVTKLGQVILLFVTIGYTLHRWKRSRVEHGKGKREKPSD